MLVERGLQVMNVEVVGDAYAIASNYLRKSGAIADSIATNERLLEIIVRCSSTANSTGSARQQGDRANSKSNYRLTDHRRIPWKPPSTASCRPTICC